MGALHMTCYVMRSASRPCFGSLTTFPPQQHTLCPPKFHCSRAVLACSQSLHPPRKRTKSGANIKKPISVLFVTALVPHSCQQEVMLQHQNGLHQLHLQCHFSSNPTFLGGWSTK